MTDIIDQFERNPVEQFQKWYQAAKNIGLTEIDVCSLATVDEQAKPHSRIVLFKGFSGEDFRIFTNYESKKAKEMAINPNVALNFYWYLPLGYQVRVEGLAKKLSREESVEYFMSRPRDSRLSAWASEQSSVLKDREELDAEIQRVEEKFAGKEVTCPENWGGYGIEAQYFEFMILDKYRAHDRFSYKREAKLWQIQRLAP